MSERSNGSSAGLFPIRTVSQLTGVNPITLRAWEKRHALIEPIRKESGHRLYSQQHIDLITRVVGLLDRGMRIGQVKEFLDNEQLEALENSADDSVALTDFWRSYRDSMVAAVINFDEEGLERTYNRALSLHPIEMVTRDLISPLLAELGRRWDTGTGSVAEEHFFAFYLRNKLGARFHHRHRNPRGPGLLMACLPGDRHEVGLLLYALSCNEAGYRPSVLGADMPIAELAAAAAKTSAQGIILAGTLTLDSRVLDFELPKLVADVEVPVLLGGRTSVEHFDALRRIDIEPLGADMESGLRKLKTVIPLE